MSYLSLNFVVPENLESPDSIELISCGEGKFFLRLNYDKRCSEIMFPSFMHVLYEDNVDILLHNFNVLCRNNLRFENVQKEDEKKLVSEEFSKRSRRKKSKLG